VAFCRPDLSYYRTHLETSTCGVYKSREDERKFSNRSSYHRFHNTPLHLSDLLHIHPTQLKWIPSSPSSPPPRPPSTSSRISLLSSRPMEVPPAVDASLLEHHNIRYVSLFGNFFSLLTTAFLLQSDTAHSIMNPHLFPFLIWCAQPRFIMPDSGLTESVS